LSCDTIGSRVYGVEETLKERKVTKKILFLLITLVMFFGGTLLLKQENPSIEPPHWGIGLVLIVISAWSLILLALNIRKSLDSRFK
jgi:hypothetical protein